MDGYDRKARRARLRLIGVGVAAAAVLAGGGVLVGNAMGGKSEQAAAPTDADSEKDTAASAPGPSATGKKYTPATAPHRQLLKPRKNEGVIGVGFPHSSLGATSAAVSYWEDLTIIDDLIARKQLTAIASEDSQASIDMGVSEIRKLREGAGLPPSGGTPNGLLFTTEVEAVLVRSLDYIGDVIQVWMVYDRYATSPDGGGDKDPLKDEVTDMIVKWEDGDWKVTEEGKYTKNKTGPRAYSPDSTYAFQDGWRMVAGG